MAGKGRITRDAIIEAGFALVREEGEEKLNARSVAARIGCSTPPVMYVYKTMTELRADILERANEFHTSFLSQTGDGDTDVLIDLGMNYIRFAAEEKNLFRFIAMSDKSGSSGLAELISSEDAEWLLLPLEQKYGLTSDQARDAVEALFVSFHGFAALIAFNSSAYDPAHCKRQLVRIYNGAIGEILRNSRKIQENA